MKISPLPRLLTLLWFAALPATGFSLEAGKTGAEVQGLVDQYGCMSCHGLVHKQVGPGFAQVADRYRLDTNAPVALAGRIRNGGVGNWGRLVMPRQPRMSEAESLQLSHWVLNRPPAP